MLLSAAPTAVDIAAAIEAVWANPAANQAMRQPARETFEQRLNGRAWGHVMEVAVVQAVVG